jgi:glycerol-3-phosphate O-acyltransferase
VYKSFIQKHTKKSSLAKQLMSQIESDDESIAIIATSSNWLDLCVIRTVLKSTFPKASILNGLPTEDEKDGLKVFLISSKLGQDFVQSSSKLKCATLFLCWKRKTRRKNVGIKWFSVNSIMKFKRLLFNKKDLFITINYDELKTITQLNKSFEQNIRALNGIIYDSGRSLVNAILTEKKLSAHLNNRNKYIRKAKRYIREIETQKSLRMIAKISVVLDLVWRFTLEGIYVDKEGINKLRKLSKNKQIVYLPSHRSHADYLMIGYIIYKYGLDTPVTAAGVNLSFFPMGPVFRGAGAYFIRRSFSGNPTYSTTFKTYLKLMMQSGSPHMFYIEGGRSRSGKLLSPKLGMLSMLVDYYRNGEVDDFYFAPLSVEYGKLFEGQSYIDELTGGEKQKESMFAMFDTLKYFKKRQGITYVQFAEPFSIAEFYNNLPVKDLSVREYNQSIKKLGNSIIHRMNSVVTVTPSGILSLILLSNTRRGIHQQELLRSCKMIFNYLRTKGVRIAIDKNHFEDEFLNVLNTFEYNAYIKRVEFNNSIIYKTKNNSRYFLDYYKNNLIHLFLPLSFVSVVIRSNKKDTISYSELFEELEHLKSLFIKEFIYNEEIWSEKNLLETLKFFAIVKEVRLEDEVIYRTRARGVHWLEITYNILRNFLEGYYIASSNLLSLGQSIAERDFYDDLNKKSSQMFEVGELQMIESNSKDIYQNAMIYCAEKKWISLRVQLLSVLLKHVF